MERRQAKQKPQHRKFKRWANTEGVSFNPGYREG